MQQTESTVRKSTESEEICEMNDNDTQVWDGYGILPASFDPNHPKYRCCCGHMHATVGYDGYADNCGLAEYYCAVRHVAGYRRIGGFA
ncbi:hypothetical protein OESDEN_09581 [Oesophagostomum dentatum]|uniref:Uncharacterized protein n=1 Tax=Oesophagostomum dentatum TaxID=61180 RepID=A0A0B1T5C3_OESDE|nr:hypothetical protein OESDEN_09581 [Oesophagostomum dentatum]